MPTDPSIILGVNGPGQNIEQATNALAAITQLRQIQQDQQSQNTLKQLLSDPANLDPETGLPTNNTLAQYTRQFPQAGMKLIGSISEIRDRQANAAHVQSETQQNTQKAYTEELGGALRAYDGELASGNVPPEMAERNLRQQISDFIDAEPIANDRKTQLKQAALSAPIAQLRAYATTNEIAAESDRIAQQAKAKTQTSLPVAEAQRYLQEHPNATAEDIAAFQAQNRPKPASLSSLEAQRYIQEHPNATAEQIANFAASSRARSAPAMAVHRFMQENPGATAEDIAKFAGQYKATVTAGGAPAVAEAAGLTNLTKMRDSVAQAEGNASREADLTLSLLDKGGLPGGPSAFGKWVQGARTGIFNDPDASSFQTAVESLKNEYVKVLSTQGGMSGGQSSDAARREADTYINPRLSKEQIRANIAVMRRSMQNRTEAINAAIKTAQGKVRQSAGVPTDLPDPGGHPDGTKARNKKGQVVAVIRDGQWSSP